MKKLFFIATLLTLNTATVFGMLPGDNNENYNNNRPHSNINRFANPNYTFPNNPPRIVRARALPAIFANPQAQDGIVPANNDATQTTNAARPSTVSGYNHPPQVSDYVDEFCSDEDEDLTHDQYYRKIRTRIANNEYATAAVMLAGWQKLLSSNVSDADAQAHIDNFERLHNEVQTNAANHGQRNKARFTKLASKAAQTIANVRAAGQANNNNNNNNNSNNNANLQ